MHSPAIDPLIRPLDPSTASPRDESGDGSFFDMLRDRHDTRPADATPGPRPVDRPADSGGRDVAEAADSGGPSRPDRTAPVEPTGDEVGADEPIDVPAAAAVPGPSEHAPLPPPGLANAAILPQTAPAIAGSGRVVAAAAGNADTGLRTTGPDIPTGTGDAPPAPGTVVAEAADGDSAAQPSASPAKIAAPVVPIPAGDGRPDGAAVDHAEAPESDGAVPPAPSVAASSAPMDADADIVDPRGVLRRAPVEPAPPPGGPPPKGQGATAAAGQHAPAASAQGQPGGVQSGSQHRNETPAMLLAAANRQGVAGAEADPAAIRPAGVVLPDTAAPTAAAATASGGVPTILSAASGGAAGRAAVVPAPATDQVILRMQKAVGEGVDRLTLRLKPASLGRVEVRMDISQDGHVQAVVTADRPETLAMLQRDARTLAQALQDAGLQADGDSLEFNLRGNGDGRAGHSGDDAAPDDDATTMDAPAPAEPRDGTVTIGLGRLDIRV